MPQESQDFGDVIAKAQRVTAGDVASPFAGREAYVPRGKVGTEFSFNSHVRVYAIPTDATDYEEVMDLIMSGEAILRYEEKTFDKDGNFLVAICWLTPRPQRAVADNIAAGDAEPGVRPQKIP